MNTNEMAQLPIGQVVAREGYVFLWTTNKYLGDAFSLLVAWGLSYRQTLTWCKPEVGGLGGMFGTNVEFVLIAQRINPGTYAHGSRTNRERVPTSWFQWPSGEHSEKPDDFYAVAQRVAPGPYMDVFARKRRDGWICIGDAVDGREITAALGEYRAPETPRKP